jgi:polyribonucleotide nucleotidyltransferase
MAVEVGSIVEGKITGVKKFGAFVALPAAKPAWYTFPRCPTSISRSFPTF